MKKLLLFVFLFLLAAKTTSAQLPTPTFTPTPTPNVQGGQGGISYTVDEYVDANMPFATITFSGLAESSKIWFFPKTKQDEVRAAKKLNEESTDGSGNYTTKVCGAGNDALKGDFNDKECRTNGKDFFHEGNIYRLGAYDDEDGIAQIIVAQFYVNHSYPTIKLIPQRSGNLSTVRVELGGKRLGGDNQNNYQLVLESKNQDQNYKQERCPAPIKSGPPTTKRGEQTDFLNASIESGTNSTFTTTTDSQGGIPDGKYLLKVNERINEGGYLAGRYDRCQGGFTYVHIPFTLSNGAITIDTANVSFDPNSSDSSALEEISNFYPAPCSAVDPNNPKKCTAVRTAIGMINVTPEGFVKSMFEFFLMLATFGGMIIIIYAGYILMTSRGDKEKLAAARETLTSAIVGLLFIVLSLVILEIIGVDVLRIPGFSR